VQLGYAGEKRYFAKYHNSRYDLLYGSSPVPSFPFALLQHGALDFPARRFGELIDEVDRPRVLVRRGDALRTARLIFPLVVLGSSSTKSIARGYLYGAVTLFT
jgi:hypothetical protein